METITQQWLPSEKTVNALKKRGITSSQYKPIVMQFRRENHEKQVKDATTKFYKMFDKMQGHDMPKPDFSKSEALDKKREDDLENRSDNSSTRAEEVKESNSGKMSQDEAIAWLKTQRSA